MICVASVLCPVRIKTELADGPAAIGEGRFKAGKLMYVNGAVVCIGLRRKAITDVETYRGLSEVFRQGV